MRNLGRLLLWLGLLALAGCGTPAVPYDRSTAGDIKTIGLITPRYPDRAYVILASTVGQSFGLIGALVDAGMRSSRESSFASLLASQRYSAPDVFEAQLVAALQAQGYTVEKIAVTRDRQQFLTDYHFPTDVHVDAYLDCISGGYGYIAAGITSEAAYRPIFHIACKLLRVADGAILMRDSVIYNPVNPKGGFVSLPPDPTYQFVDFDTLMGDPPRAIAGLNDAATKTAQAVGTLLH